MHLFQFMRIIFRGRQRFQTCLDPGPDLAAALTPCHRAILEGRAGLTAANLEGRSQLLLAWASSVLEELS